MRKPNFENLLKVLRNERPDRPTLYEFIVNDKFLMRAAGITSEAIDWDNDEKLMKMRFKGFAALGYDYASVMNIGMQFLYAKQEHVQSISQNDGVMITDRKSFEEYPLA
ncbi:MAG: hypothetical protein U9O87_01345 [Verrucomicrobiota bacterium]|nr:hypothetical protein [Verrucomicrobiota bacterium]